MERQLCQHQNEQQKTLQRQKQRAGQTSSELPTKRARTEAAAPSNQAEELPAPSYGDAVSSKSAAAAVVQQKPASTDLAVKQWHHHQQHQQYNQYQHPQYQQYQYQQTHQQYQYQQYQHLQQYPQRQYQFRNQQHQHVQYQHQQNQHQQNQHKQYQHPHQSQQSQQRQQRRLQQHQQAHQEVPSVVPACEQSCRLDGADGWCQIKVHMPHMDGRSLAQANVIDAEQKNLGNGCEQVLLPGGVQVLLVNDAIGLPAALQQLRASMQDSVIAIDLEWKPTFVKGQAPNRVALLQLASSSVAVLMRTCKHTVIKKGDLSLPEPLLQFLQDPQVQLLGCGWRGGDEQQMQRSFGVGSGDFGCRMLDLQDIAKGLGYCSLGLKNLVRHVLQLQLPSGKKTTMSDWENWTLNLHQIKYAALDVLLAGQVFRQLRHWHSPATVAAVCSSCQAVFGSAVPHMALKCSCSQEFPHLQNYISHCKSAGHCAQYEQCSKCGRPKQLTV